MTRWLWSTAILAVLGYLGLCAVLFVAQSALIYVPRAAGNDSAAHSFALAVDGATLRVVHRDRPGRKALIYFGGNAENVRRSLPGLAQAFPDRALYLMQYRGYGGSTGRPSEAALFADALVLFDRVSARHDNIQVIGRSLGSGVATYLAAQRPVAALMLVTPYDSIANVAAERLPMFPVHWLLLDKYESWRYAPDVKAPTWIVAAEHDEVISRARTDALLPHFADGVARLHVIPGAGHNDIGADPAYARLLGARR